MLNIYETVVILSPDLDEEASKAHAESLKNLIAEWGGTVDTVDLWGRRNLEYEIARKREGIYYLLLYKIDTENNPSAKIDRMMNLDETVLRHLTVRRDDLMKARAKKMKEKREIRRAKREERARAEAEAAAQREAEAIAAREAARDAAEAEASEDSAPADAPEAKKPEAAAAPASTESAE